MRICEKKVVLSVKCQSIIHHWHDIDVYQASHNEHQNLNILSSYVHYVHLTFSDKNEVKYGLSLLSAIDIKSPMLTLLPVLWSTNGVQSLS